MKPATEAFTFPRRDLLKAGGALLIGFASAIRFARNQRKGSP